MNEVYLKEPERDNTGKIRKPWDDKFYRTLQRLERKRVSQAEESKNGLTFLGYSAAVLALRDVMEAYKEFHSE